MLTIAIIVALFCLAAAGYAVIGYIRIKKKLKIYTDEKSAIENMVKIGVVHNLAAFINSLLILEQISKLKAIFFCKVANELPAILKSQYMLALFLDKENVSVLPKPLNQPTKAEPELFCLFCKSYFPVSFASRYPKVEGETVCPYCESNKTVNS